MTVELATPVTFPYHRKFDLLFLVLLHRNQDYVIGRLEPSSDVSRALGREGVPSSTASRPLSSSKRLQTAPTSESARSRMR